MGPIIPDMPQSKDFPDSFYRIGIKGLLVRDGKILLQQDTVTHTRPPIWELPGGGLDYNETFQDGLRREVREENGLEVDWIADKPTYLWTDRRENSRQMEWFYVLLLCFRFEVKSLDFTPSDECRELRFFSQDELKKEPMLAPQLQPLKNLFNPADFA